MEELELAARQYHHQYPYPESVGSGRGRHSPVGSDHGSSLGARSVGGREEAEAGAHVLNRRRVAMSRVPIDQVCGRGLGGGSGNAGSFYGMPPSL